RQPSQAQQDQDGGDHLDQQLGGGQVRGRQPQEADAADQAGAAHQHQGGQPVELGQGRSPDGAGPPDQPQDGEGRVDGGQGLGARLQPRAAGRRHARGQGEDHDEQHLRLQPLAGEQPLDPFGPGVADALQQPLEDQLALDRTNRRLAQGGQPSAQQAVGGGAGNEGEDAHDQGRGQAVPDRQGLAGRGLAQHGPGRLAQARPDG